MGIFRLLFGEIRREVVQGIDPSGSLVKRIEEESDPKDGSQRRSKRPREFQVTGEHRLPRVEAKAQIDRVTEEELPDDVHR